MQEGPEGLQDRSSRPHHSPGKTPAKREERIRKLRLRGLQAFQIARLLGMARSTVSAVLVRLGLNKQKALEPREPARRYERDRPGDLIHLDIKKLGRIRGIGHRVHGDRRTSQRGIGWEFVHVCIDDHSRVSYVEVHDDERGETAAGFLHRAVEYFASLGVRVQRVLTDNGGCYRSKEYKSVASKLGVGLRYTRPYRPQTNGKAERFIQTLLREWAYVKPFKSSRGRRQALQPWVRYYNEARPHGSLGCRPPMTRISGSG